ncbi:MAG TPA: AfsR/SARP family transcriptional regulator [Streptosporangiaceae bacterium]|nr:AfsR/SARP family transcriptional regulator [Streptosporangiaceae bacterium]
MRFGILGPLVAEADDGSAISLTRPSQRATLAVLLFYTGQPATKTLLIEALWGDSPPGDADTALRVRMRDLRRALAGHDRITTHPSGYQIGVGPGELDADTFRALLLRGRSALDAGNTEGAARLLAQACRLWRDPPLADVPDTPLMRAAAIVLQEQRREAREWLADARLALGHHHDLLSQIRAVIAADPLPEHPHVQLMLALYRCGNKAAALDAYSRLRDLTTREFGQDPGPEAREMLRMLLNDSPALQFRPRALTASGNGSPSVWTPLLQLPAPPPDFTGRVAEIEALARRMPGQGMEITVLTGPPGVGKTALAVRAAHLAAGSFPDGQLYVDLGGRQARREPIEILGELLRSIGVPSASMPTAMAERAALYRSMLAGRRVLVVADDAAAAAQVRPLLPGTHGSAVLVTSSYRLADLEGARCIEVGPLSPLESITMLSKIVADERLPADPAATAAIAAACAGLPLALRVAGARLAASPALRPADLAAALAEPGALPAELAIGDLSVRDRLERAWRALELTEREVLWMLARMQLPAVPDWLMPAPTAGSERAGMTLADAGMLRQDPDTGDYQIAPLVNAFALGQAPPGPDAAHAGAALLGDPVSLGR